MEVQKNVKYLGKDYPWQEGSQRKVEEIAESFVRTFEAEGVQSRFSVHHIDPFGYKTRPVIIDYRLFVDIATKNLSSGEVTKVENIYLGAYYNSPARKIIPFGEEYFKSTYPELIEIVGLEYRNGWKFVTELSSISKWNRGFAQSRNLE